jgi:DNA segregation ATPase FtsK/SpoIIIE, S-DNA-T family
MSRKAAEASDHRGFSDVVGIVLLALSLLLSAALFSFDRNDVSYYTSTPNEQPSNWIGPVGAYSAQFLILAIGAASYILPVLLLAFGLAGFFQIFAYLRNRVLWGFLLLVACIGLLDIYSDDLQLVVTQDAGSAGGMAGMILNKLIFSHFGRVGASIILGALYLVSLLYLTNFRIGAWIRSLFARVEKEPAELEGLSPEEKALERRARELQKHAQKLQEQMANAGLGADLQPFPEPTVRDLSVPQPRHRKGAINPFGLVESAGQAVLQEGEVITAKEIEAAGGAETLDRPAAEASGDERKESFLRPADRTAAINDSSAPPKAKRRKPITVATPPVIGNYKMPPVSLLNEPDASIKPTESKEELMSNARLMQSTLAQFGIDVSLGDITKGPTITRYELYPAPGVKLEKITGLTNNIAAALKAERIHILAPVPGKSSVGVEVPNAVKTKVIMRDLLESEEWQKTKARIPLALGKDVYGHPIIADLAEMPHLMIAGSTGSGKSVCINAIIASLLSRFSPDQLRFVMIDPKVVELQQYNALPHLVVPVVNDPKKVILALRWVVNEMEKRYQIFAKAGVRNIKSFNERPKAKESQSLQPELPLPIRKEKIEPTVEGFAVELDEEIVVPREDEIVIPEKLSYIVVIIDELADLMLVAPADVELAIARITQMARAAGIHCIVATQRPSVDVITGVIKANIPARIAFQVAAKVDSRTILDAMGADKLLGKGDMLYLPPGSAKLTRAQGVLITDQEIQEIVDFIARQGKPSYEVEIHQQLSKSSTSMNEDNGFDEDEELIQQCIEVIRSEQKASVSLMQRRLRLGYTRAARIMDELEKRGIVGPNKGAEPRDILIDLDGTGADGRGEG